MYNICVSNASHKIPPPFQMAKKEVAAPAAPPAPAAPVKVPASTSSKKITEGVNAKLQLVTKSGAYYLSVPRISVHTFHFILTKVYFFTLSLSLSLSGKYCLGQKQTLKALRSGKSQMILISSNIPKLRKAEIIYYAMLARTPALEYSGNNIDLGTACGKLYKVSVLSVQDAGDSDILSLDSLEPLSS